jgi:hypothetical protein
MPNNKIPNVAEAAKLAEQAHSRCGSIGRGCQAIDKTGDQSSQHDRAIDRKDCSVGTGEGQEQKKKSGTPLGGRDPQMSVRVKNIHVSLHASWKSSQREKQEAADKASMDQRRQGPYR